MRNNFICITQFAGQIVVIKLIIKKSEIKVDDNVRNTMITVSIWTWIRWRGILKTEKYHASYKKARLYDMTVAAVIIAASEI